MAHPRYHSPNENHEQSKIRIPFSIRNRFGLPAGRRGGD